MKKKYVEYIPQMKEMYNEGRTLREIEMELNIPAKTVMNYLVKLKIPLRRRGARKGVMGGDKHPLWKGDKAKAVAGGARARRKFNHPKGLEIHHADGNPLNNNPENILFVTRKEHMILDGRLTKLASQSTSERAKSRKRDVKGRFCCDGYPNFARRKWLLNAAHREANPEVEALLVYQILGDMKE